MVKTPKATTTPDPDTILRNPKSGELFISTAHQHWSFRLRAWKADQSLPCPMPAGHLMFKHPASYGLQVEEVR